MINLGFWKEQSIDKKTGLKKSLFVIAPMADVTDASFRKVIAERGGPDVMWTEFVSADGLIRATEEGKKKLLRDLIYCEAERPIVAQLFGSNPEYMRQAAALCAKIGFDGIDINMGCPDKSIEKQKAGAAMIKDPKRAQEIIRAAQEGVKDSGKNIPVSVKTRIGYNSDELDTWLPALLTAEPAVVTIHARTRKEMSLVPARWEHVKHAVEIRDHVQADLPPDQRTLIFGNGDVLSLLDGQEKVTASGADGAMLGRAIFGNPWLFAPLHRADRDLTTHIPTVKEKLDTLVEHSKLFEEILGDIKSFSIMKKHFKAYVNGFDGSKELRARLMEMNTAKEVAGEIKAFLEDPTNA